MMMKQTVKFSTRPGRPGRRLRRVAGGIGLAITLMGCSPSGADGQSKETADAALSGIPGIGEGSVNTRSIVSGLQEETYTTIKVSVETGFSVPDPAALVDYLIRVAWSTDTQEATSSLEVIVVSDPPISIAEALEMGAWPNTGSDPNFPDGAVLDVVDVEERFGDWPGDVPGRPDGLVVGPTTAPAL